MKKCALVKSKTCFTMQWKPILIWTSYQLISFRYWKQFMLSIVRLCSCTGHILASITHSRHSIPKPFSTRRGTGSLHLYHRCPARLLHDALDTSSCPAVGSISVANSRLQSAKPPRFDLGQVEVWSLHKVHDSTSIGRRWKPIRPSQFVVKASTNHGAPVEYPYK